MCVCVGVDVCECVCIGVCMCGSVCVSVCERVRWFNCLYALRGMFVLLCSCQCVNECFCVFL